ncbi:MAG: hypothetical protein ACLP5H_32300 [Desulfomonilaceae bacterium]
MSEKTCWEFKNCPPTTRENCPAYPNHGRDCWQVMGKKEICLFDCSFPEKIAKGEE